MTAAIVFPDVELWATGYLRGKLDQDEITDTYAATYGVYVGRNVPPDRRGRMVTVRRDGGPRLDVVREAARLGINVYGERDEDTAQLAALVRAWLGAAAGDGPVLRVTELSGPSPIDDEQPRRFFSVELIVRGTRV